MLLRARPFVLCNLELTSTIYIPLLSRGTSPDLRNCLSVSYEVYKGGCNNALLECTMDGMLMRHFFVSVLKKMKAYLVFSVLCPWCLYTSFVCRATEHLIHC